MIDADERRLLEDIRKWEDTGPPAWKDAWWNWVMLAGGAAQPTPRIAGAGLSHAWPRAAT